MTQYIENLQTKEKVLVLGGYDITTYLLSDKKFMLTIPVIEKDFYKIMGTNYHSVPFYLHLTGGQNYIKIHHVVPAAHKIQIGSRRCTILELMCLEMNEFELIKFMNDLNTTKKKGENTYV